MPYLAPTSASEALSFLHDVITPRVVAGCTDFFPNQPLGVRAQPVLDVTRIEGFRGITETADGWRIGAATPWADIARADLPPAFDTLRLAAREVGSIQIQNRGTIAGNICNASPAADGMPPLLALDAQVEVASHRAGTRTVPLDRFVTGVRKTDLATDELVTAILVPPIAATANSAFLKLGSRSHLVISIAMVAAVVRVADKRIVEARIAVGSCAPTAVRMRALEAQLTGMTAGRIATMDFAAGGLLAALNPISDVRGTAGYRLDAAAEMCRRSILAAFSGNQSNA